MLSDDSTRNIAEQI